MPKIVRFTTCAVCDTVKGECVRVDVVTTKLKKAQVELCRECLGKLQIILLNTEDE